ncbi:uncharacterized protein LOC143901687 [Temnothorax americanus]|uniref:uncharacterized protein LOC143901687 n=1 Tax=Temnothorax americanus TaxID=1964332 RepID=UPI004068D349
MGKRKRKSTSKEDRRERIDRKIRRLEKKLEREKEKRYASSHRPLSRKYSGSSSRQVSPSSSKSNRSLSELSESRRSRSWRPKSRRPSLEHYRRRRVSSECSSSEQSTSGRHTPRQQLAADNQQPDREVLSQTEIVSIDLENNNAVVKDKELAGMAEPGTVADIPEHEIDFQQEVLEVIGSRLESDNKLADAIHKDVALRWAEILRNGLPVEEVKKLLEKYPPPQNCTIIAVPKLNAEIISAVQETAIKRDKRIVEKQERITAGLGALGKAISIALKIEGAQRILLLEKLSDAGRLFASVHREESLARKSLILANLNTGLKDTLSNTSVDDWLFSGNLEGVIKSAKIIEEASKTLKPPGKPRQQKGTKNWKGPTRQSSYRGRPSTSGRYRQSSSAPSTRKPPQRRESSHHSRKRR